jgi:outer membrane receptor for ferric coprogen and ferric-rhodotorulic acid
VVSNSSLTGAERDILFNRRLAKSPEYQGGLWNRYSFSSGRLKGLAVGAGAHGQTKTMPRYDSYLDQDGFNKAFLVFDLNLDYTTTIASKKTRLSLSVNNLTDKLYNLGTFAYGQPRKMEFTVKTFF